MKKISNIFTIVLVLLTSLVFGQTQTINGFSNLMGGNNHTSVGTTTSNVSGNCIISITTNAPSAGGVVLTFNTSFGTSTVQVPANGLNTITFTTNITLSNPVTSFTLTSNNFDFLSYNVTITPSMTTGISNVTKTDLPLDMYSNLTTIFVKNNENIENVKLEVFNLAGQLVFEEEKVTKNEYELNVATGIYIVRLSKEDNFKVKKVFIGQ